MSPPEQPLRVEDITCPRCGAAAGELCRRRASKRTGPHHEARHDAWRTWAWGWAERERARQAAAEAACPEPLFNLGEHHNHWGQTYVRVWHRSTGVVVVASDRSQLKARTKALRVLRAAVAQVNRGWSMPVDVVRSYEGAVGDLPDARFLSSRD